MSYKQEVLTSAYKDIYKATKILGDLGDLDHNLAYVEGVSSYTTIIRSCEQILLAVAEELYQVVAKEDENGEE
jgi:hypothetical protein